MSRVTPKIFDEDQGAHEEKGELARMSAFFGAYAVADLVKTTLGPKGMDKILQSQGGAKITVTNDGATILKAVPVDNPAAKILIDTSKTQDAEIGDGTTSVVVFAGELLRQAERLMNQKIHPQTIISGWRKAIKCARQALESSAIDHSTDKKQFRDDLVNIAMTTLSSKILNVDKSRFANLAVDAVLRLKGSIDLENIQIIKKLGGSLSDSFLDEGFILDKQLGIGQPRVVNNPKILVANTPMDADKIKIYAAVVQVNSMDKVAEIEKAERKRMKTKVDKILAHNIDVFINRQLIYDYPEQLFTDAGKISIEHADFEGIERLAKVLGAEITSTFDHPDLIQLGTCARMEEIMIGEDRCIHFSGVPKGEACTIVLRGASQHILDEAERSLHDALCVLSQTAAVEHRTVLGAGCSEMLMANAVDELAKISTGKEALAIEGFAAALRQIPSIIADNAGLDSSELVANLRAAHYKGDRFAGIDIENGVVADVQALKITESLKCKMQVVISGHEAAEMILRVDEIITSAPRPRGGGGH